MERVYPRNALRPLQWQHGTKDGGKVERVGRKQTVIGMHGYNTTWVTPKDTPLVLCKRPAERIALYMTLSGAM